MSVTDPRILDLLNVCSRAVTDLSICYGIKSVTHTYVSNMSQKSVTDICT